MINIMQLVQMARSGGDPTMMIRQMAQQNPMLQNALSLLDGKSQQEQMQLLQGMAKERGVSLEQVAQRMGLPMR